MPFKNNEMQENESFSEENKHFNDKIEKKNNLAFLSK